VSVRKCDTLEAAATLENPLVLILADDQRPGGNFRALAGMQEESLFLRSALHRHLLPDMYPLGLEESLYAPDVPLLAGGTACFIACPGLKMPQLVEGRFSVSDRLILEKKVELIIQVAVRFDHPDIVLGALGCGVWGCLPQDVAEVMAEVLQRYSGMYRNALVAVLGGNYNTFHNVLADRVES
jgi:uncharacterized protein (TIGR02452 family)